jgi:soluble lytic murein transglycosylase-like protein
MAYRKHIKNKNLPTLGREQKRTLGTDYSSSKGTKGTKGEIMILRSIIWFSLFSSALLHARRQNFTKMLIWCAISAFVFVNALPSFGHISPVILVLLSDAPLVPDMSAPPEGDMPAPEGDMPAPPEGDWANVPEAVARWRSLIKQAANECNVDAFIVAAIMTQESGGDAAVCSSMGACGLMQLMPATGIAVNVTDRFDPAQSIRGGACYYASMKKRYGDRSVAIAAYNAGPGNVDKYGGIPPFRETQLYVKNVTAFYKKYISSKKSISEFSVNPFKGFTITSRFQTVNLARPNHKGLDLVAGSDTIIYAVESGIVEHVGPFYCAASCLGPHAIVINHGGGGWRSVYGHGYAHVKVGDSVKAGQAIGQQGGLGNATGPHLHLEIRTGGRLEINGEGVANIVGSELKNPEEYLRKK